MRLNIDDLVRRINSGTSYQTIASEYGVSKQYIAGRYLAAVRDQTRLSLLDDSRAATQLSDRRRRDIERCGKTIPDAFWDVVQSANETLPRNDQIVISLLSGRSLKQTAQQFGLSYQRVSQIWDAWVDNLPRRAKTG